MATDQIRCVFKSCRSHRIELSQPVSFATRRTSTQRPLAVFWEGGDPQVNKLKRAGGKHVTCYGTPCACKQMTDGQTESITFAQTTHNNEMNWFRGVTSNVCNWYCNQVDCFKATNNLSTLITLQWWIKVYRWSPLTDKKFSSIFFPEKLAPSPSSTLLDKVMSRHVMFKCSFSCMSFQWQCFSLRNDLSVYLVMPHNRIPK